MARQELEIDELKCRIKKLRIAKSKSMQQNTTVSCINNLVREMSTIANDDESMPILSTTRDMIHAMYTDKPRLLPLANSRLVIMENTKANIGDACNTSKVIVKKEKDIQKKNFDELF